MCRCPSLYRSQSFTLYKSLKTCRESMHVTNPIQVMNALMHSVSKTISSVQQALHSACTGDSVFYDNQIKRRQCIRRGTACSLSFRSCCPVHGALREEAQLLASVGTTSRHSVCFQVVLISSAWIFPGLCTANSCLILQSIDGKVYASSLQAFSTRLPPRQGKRGQPWAQVDRPSPCDKAQKASPHHACWRRFQLTRLGR